ncbi:hypothetical protein L6452_06986 [Arctium lappa]|uniref:Uncharacterized protein n=1 Tax=Arctium lappa TaxID=4217 RepID=A0ACB9EKC9_ARCLA|nr:hypothetical protein L6452_06986 [Arctium lappa]
MTKGEPSGTKPSDTNCYAAASLQHEQFVRRKERNEEPVVTLLPRPTSPHNGFSSKAATKMWPKFQTKIGFPEKGIDEHSLREFHFIRQVVDTQGLNKLCRVYDSYNLTLVREFYCEMSVTSASKIHVRGTTVHLTAKRINQFLELNPPKKTEYYALVHKATASDLAEVVAVLGKPKTNWESHTNLMLRTFRASNLTADSNEVLAQNSNLMDTILQQRNEFIERLEDLKVEMQSMVDDIKKGDQQKENAEVKKLRKMVKRQKKEIADLKVKLTAEESAHIGAAASSLIAVSLAASVGHKQPTQPE